MTTERPEALTWKYGGDDGGAAAWVQIGDGPCLFARYKPTGSYDGYLTEISVMRSALGHDVIHSYEIYASQSDTVEGARAELERRIALLKMALAA